MSLNNRLNKLEEQLNKKGEVIIRLVGCNGYYPEQDEDKQSNKNIVKICVEGVSYEELKEWSN
jgi:hypothetical protein